MNRKSLTVGSLINGKKQFLPSKNTNVPQSKIHLQQNRLHAELTPVSHQTLLDATLDQGQLLDYACRKGTCGRCTVEVITGASLLHTPNKKEQKKLQHLLTEGYRLACQATIR
ncbi:2Fe-2S iron-sulfur cluster-binding protein [Aneurinibacillus migulanus]|uniref:2Fe-2S iron-sulfur cluster-binding protein n=1 Tax=Aneurinibacillus migulanus TaxID=47500 RepID=UPI000A7FC4CC|nr:2Fe-2S iron-sulfur cluster-binding protein [Aneurinibacillus migulanus]MCP1357896.1 (2Fe-2S)-binding protein [Aneurinibacillus migulanus]